MVVVTGALLVVVGVWALARGAPSAESDPTPLPTPTPTRLRERFGRPPFPTARPAVIRHAPEPASPTGVQPTAPVTSAEPGPRGGPHRRLFPADGYGSATSTPT